MRSKGEGSFEAGWVSWKELMIGVIIILMPILRASPTELPLCDLEKTLAACKVYLSSRGAATKAAKGSRDGPKTPLAALPV